MKVTYNWLKEFVDFDLPPAELGHLLTMQGLEVEGMTSIGNDFDEVVVAYVEERRQHPNADKLSLCTVFDGSERMEVVCGAPNVHTGATVALARIGAVLPGDFKIKRSKIRGVESCGMICSERELGLSEESEGIMLLPAGLPLGRPLFEALGLKDTVFEIGLTPNRADCLSVVGIAREIAAKLGSQLKNPAITVREEGAAITGVASVTIDDPDLCPRYTARHISGCTIAPSPSWLVNRLKSVGMRAINNVVDVTNYVLLEYGHPLHAFDYRLLAGGRIVVRRAGPEERFTTLDGQERLLTASDLTIRDGEKGVALAGIMGGGNSEIIPETTEVLLESAYFDPSTIRRTSKRLGLHTESSHRFERGADVDILTVALDRAAGLIAELAGGTMAQGIIDVYPQPLPKRQVILRLERVNAILGTSLSAAEVATVLRNLEFGVEQAVPETFHVAVPSFRVDIEREIDLVEEVARLIGFEQIPTTMPLARVFSDRPSLEQARERHLRDIMVAQGFSEVINFSFIAPEACDRLLLAEDDPRRQAVRLRNPLVEEQSVMRTTLIPSLLETCNRNLSHRLLNQRIFELRRLYLARAGEELPSEPLHLAGLITGMREADGWTQGRSTVDFYDIKGVVESIGLDNRIKNLTFSPLGVEPFYHPGKSSTVLAGNRTLGTCGELHPDILESFGINQPVYYFELDFAALVAAGSGTTGIVAPPRYPDTIRDVALLVAEEVPAAAIIETIRSIRAKEIEEALIFDVYRGEHVPAGQKSIAARVRYRSRERTLTDEEVNKLHGRVVAALAERLGAVTR